MADTGTRPDLDDHKQPRDFGFLRRQFARRKVHHLVPGLRDWGVIPSGMSDWGLIAPGFNITSQTDTREIRALIRKLAPQDCGKSLIRIGSAHDGGYLLPDDLEGINYCFSPGVNTIADFENDLADRGIKSFLADYSVDAPPLLRPELTFDKKFLGSFNNDRFMTLDKWKDRYLGDYADDLILQMDIEGAEYEVIFNLSDELLQQFRIIVIEFHSLQLLFVPIAFSFLSTCFEKLLESFYVAHIHPNNSGDIVRRDDIEIPMSMEFTFLNKKRVGATTPALKFPHAFDRPNDPARTDMNLPKCWRAVP